MTEAEAEATIREALREFVGDGDGADEEVLRIYREGLEDRAYDRGYENALNNAAGVATPDA